MEILKFVVKGFRTCELYRFLGGSFRNLAQIRYELQKLIVRKLVTKLQGKSMYRVTRLGWQWLWAVISSRRHFVTPVISRAYKNDFKKIVSQPSNLEKAYGMLEEGLNLITKELALI